MSNQGYNVLVWFKDRDIEQQVLDKLNERFEKNNTFYIYDRHNFLADYRCHVLVTDHHPTKHSTNIPETIYTLVYASDTNAQQHQNDYWVFSENVDGYPLRIKAFENGIKDILAEEEKNKTESQSETKDEVQVNNENQVPPKETIKENNNQTSTVKEEEEEKQTKQETFDVEKVEKTNDYEQPTKEKNDKEEESDLVAQLADRSRNIQRQAVLGYDFQPNQTIAVWSPLGRMGTTTFVINFAIYLAEQKMNAAVLEGPGSSHYLKNELKRFTSMPSDWNSYASVLHNEQRAIEQTFQWNFEGVSWFPLGTNDMEQLTWTKESMHFYVKNMKKFDVTLIDMPSGKMDVPNEWLLNDVNELWILVDDSYPHFCAYKQYMQDLLKLYPNLKVQLVFNKYFPSFSQPNKLSNELEYPLLTVLPDLHETIKKNYYQHHLLIKRQKTRKALMEGYPTLYKHLTGQEEVKRSWFKRLKLAF